MIDQFKVIVSGFVYNDNGELLVIRRADNEETFPGMLAIPGGTVEVEANAGLQQDTIENNLIRELKEETNLFVPSEQLQYEKSFVINDWRYRREVDKITTSLFTTFSWEGVPAPDDDICELQWVLLSAWTIPKIVEEHVDMFRYLVKKYGTK